jgi:hypothetical protein
MSSMLHEQPCRNAEHREVSWGMSSPGSIVDPELPAVDERLVAPETRYEIDDGKLVYVAPADPPHATCHSKVSSLLVAYTVDDYIVAIDMLTRTSKTSDIAPDASIFPRAKDPRTGGRRLEELAFEIVATQKLGDAGHKAASLTARGVRRCFAVDVERLRAFEWSSVLGTWSILDQSSSIDDPVFVIPLPVAALIQAAKIDAVAPSVTPALVAKGDPVIMAEIAHARAEGVAHGRADGVAQGRAEALLQLLELRGLHPTEPERARILAERDLERLQQWAARALTCSHPSQLFDDE